MPFLSIAPTSLRGSTARHVLVLALIGGAMGVGCTSVTQTTSENSDGGKGGSNAGGATSGIGGASTDVGGTGPGGAAGAGAAGVGGAAGAGGESPTSCDPALAPDLHANCIEDLGNSRLRITYDFDDPEQLRDFGMSANGTMEMLSGSLILTCDSSNYCAAFFRDPLLVQHATVIATPVASPDIIVSLNATPGGSGFGCYGDRLGLGFAFDESTFEQAQAVPTRVGTRYTIDVTQTASTLTCTFNGISYSGAYVLVPTTNRIFALASWSAQVAFESLVLEGQLNGG